MGKRSYAIIASVAALFVILVFGVEVLSSPAAEIHRKSVLVKGNLTVNGSTTLTGAISSSGNTTIGGTLTLSDDMVMEKGETIENGTDDMIDFVGDGGADDTDIRFDLDGTYPVVSTPTDSVIMIDEVFFVGKEQLNINESAAATDTDNVELFMKAGTGAGGSDVQGWKIELDTDGNGAAGSYAGDLYFDFYADVSGTESTIMVLHEETNPRVEVKGLIGYSATMTTIADDGAGGVAATLTLLPTTATEVLNCSDGDGCDITMDEPTGGESQTVTIANISANACNFADTAGVSELAGAFAMGQYDKLVLMYAGDRWIEISRSNN